MIVSADRAIIITTYQHLKGAQTRAHETESYAGSNNLLHKFVAKV